MRSTALPCGDLSARITLAVLRSAAQHGCDTRGVLHAAGLAALMPEGFVDIQRHFRVWELVMRQLQLPALPILVGRERALDDLQVRGFVAATSTTGMEALRRAIRYAQLTTSSGEWVLDEDHAPDVALLAFRREGPRSLGHRVSNECALASTLRMLRATLGSELCAQRVLFRHQAPRDVSMHRAFFGCEPEFGASEDGLLVSRATLARTPRKADVELSTYFERVAHAQLSERSPPSLRARVRREVEASLTTSVSMSTVAKRLGQSERTLRRTLTAEGASFQDIVVDVRLRLADKLLRDRRYDLQAVALALGFSEQSAFTRFFKQHRGTVPSSARR